MAAPRWSSPGSRNGHRQQPLPRTDPETALTPRLQTFSGRPRRRHDGVRLDQPLWDRDISGPVSSIRHLIQPKLYLLPARFNDQPLARRDFPVADCCPRPLDIVDLPTTRFSWKAESSSGGLNLRNQTCGHGGVRLTRWRRARLIGFLQVRTPSRGDGGCPRRPAAIRPHEIAPSERRDRDPVIRPFVPTLRTTFRNPAKDRGLLPSERLAVGHSRSSR
jgi:hypothetical protein